MLGLKISDQKIEMSHGVKGGRKSAKKVSLIILMTPKDIFFKGKNIHSGSKI